MRDAYIRALGRFSKPVCLSRVTCSVKNTTQEVHVFVLTTLLMISDSVVGKRQSNARLSRTLVPVLSVTPQPHCMRQRITHSFYDIPHHAPAHVWGWNPSAIMVAHTHFSVNTTMDIGETHFGVL